MASRKISTFLFDVGDVLIKLDYSTVLEFLGVPPGLDQGAVVEKLDSDSVFQAHERGEIPLNVFIERVNGVLGTTITVEEWRRVWPTVLSEEVPGMRDLIERISRDFHLMILSNTDPLHRECFDGRFPIMSFFERSFTSYEIGHLKPGREAFEAVLKETGIPAREIIFVDNLPGNVEGACAVGMEGIVFHSAEQLARKLTERKLIMPDR